MRLTAGITEKLPQWELILSQIGLPTEKVELKQPIPLDQFAVVIVSTEADETTREYLHQYLKEGGSILTEADVARWLLRIKTVPAYVKYVQAKKDPIYHGVMEGFLDGRFTVGKLASVLEGDSKRKLVQVYRDGDGCALILPGSFSKAVLDTKVRRRNFPTGGPLLPSERVSRRSKGTIRQVVQRSLEYLYWARELPFVSLWPFPNGASTVFNFRVDTDFASQEEREALYHLCHKRGISASWFMETGGSQESSDDYAHMEDQEIGLHCYRHRVFRDFIRNEDDIKKGIHLLRTQRIRPSGYVAPFGQWNVPLAKAIEHHGFVYSSEFCLDYDNLPFYPYLEDRFTSVLQVPIHPIATSRLLNAHHSDQDMKDYFKDLINRSVTHHLPVFVYDHPSRANLHVLDFLFRSIRRRKIPVMPMIDYARWWINRTGLDFNASWNDHTLTLEWTSSDPSIWLSIRKSQRDWTTTRIQEEIPFEDLTWQKTARRSMSRTPISDLWTLNRKMIVNDILHFYWKWKS